MEQNLGDLGSDKNILQRKRVAFSTEKLKAFSVCFGGSSRKRTRVRFCSWSDRKRRRGFPGDPRSLEHADECAFLFRSPRISESVPRPFRNVLVQPFSLANTSSCFAASLVQSSRSRSRSSRGIRTRQRVALFSCPQE